MKAVTRTSGDTALDALEPPRAHHHALHFDVLRSMGGAAVGASLAYLIVALAGGSVEASPLFSLLTGAGAFAGISTRRRRWSSILSAGGLGLAGTWLSQLLAQWAPLSAGVLGILGAPVLGAGERPKRMALTGLVVGGFAFAGLAVGQAVLELGLFLPLVPYPLAVAGSGAITGLFVGLASAPRHLLPALDPLDEAYADALALHDGEIHGLLTRTLGLHHAIRDILEARGDEGDDRKVLSQVEAETRRVLKIAEACRRLDLELSRDGWADLEHRAADLRRSAENASDPAARATYVDALDSLEEQRISLARLLAGRERVVARLHSTLALLDKLRLALLQTAAADTERFGAEGSATQETLDELGRELDASASAISEIFGGGPGRLPAPSVSPN